MHTLYSCHGAVVAPLSDVPREVPPALSMFPLIMANKPPFPLARRFSRVTVSSQIFSKKKKAQVKKPLNTCRIYTDIRTQAICVFRHCRDEAIRREITGLLTCHNDNTTR